MGWVIACVIVGALVLLFMKRVAGPKRQDKVIKRAGNLPRVRRCPGCGEPTGKCKEMTRRAEHPKGMLGD